ncbi:hypothetical protein PIB30_096236, partial [Stylosanthes scabra]|nr:hypothetical protein [Stylosanthes scabra]
EATMSSETMASTFISPTAVAGGGSSARAQCSELFGIGHGTRDYYQQRCCDVDN